MGDRAGRGAEGYGVSSTWVHELAEYWKSTYDGRVWEDRLNQHPLTVDGETASD